MLCLPTRSLFRQFRSRLLALLPSLCRFGCQRCQPSRFGSSFLCLPGNCSRFGCVPCFFARLCPRLLLVGGPLRCRSAWRCHRLPNIAPCSPRCRSHRLWWLLSAFSCYPLPHSLPFSAPGYFQLPSSLFSNSRNLNSTGHSSA